MLAAIHAATEYLLNIAHRQLEAVARGDLKLADMLNPEMQTILDDRSYLIREFIKLHP